MRYYNRLVLMVLLLTSMGSCSFFKKSWDNLNVFPVSQDIELGKKVSSEIEANQGEYPILTQNGNEELYKYVNGIVSKILSYNLVDYTKDFAWKVSIINDPKTLNAFCTPGGYIYVYTGLISYLDSEDQLAGVLGHEIAHAANRHSTKQLTKSLGIQILLDAALGKQEVIKQVTTALVSLNFSRAHETQADSFSVKYLCPTNWNSNGASGFFKKIEGQPTPPQWLSTHPSPANRILNIDHKAKELNCRGKESNSTKYNQIKALVAKILPAPKSASNTNTSTTIPTSKSGENTPSLPSTKSGNANEKQAPTKSSNSPTPPSKILKKG